MKDNIFASRLREARKKAGLTQIALAKMTGLSDATVANYENGKTSPTLNAAYLLADALGVTFAWLVGVDTYDYRY